jgi:signal transduction histidine kinase
VLSVHSLVTNYLDVSRIHGGRLAIRREPVPLNDVIARVCKQYAPEAARRSVALEPRLEEELPLADVDAAAVERILANLVYNAVKFTPAGGRVTVRTGARGDELLLEVADTGPGIPAERLPGLFDRARRPAAAAEGGGTGLGLHVVKTLTVALGGRVDVASEPGRGTRFAVLFPAVH